MQQLHQALYPLAKIIEDEIKHTEVLYEVLQLENEILGKHSVEQLEACIQKKTLTIQALEKLNNQRTMELDRLNKKLEPLSRQLHPPFQTVPPLAKLWGKLMELAGNSHELNIINGRLVKASCNRSKQALLILQGRTTDSKTISPVYDQHAQTNIHLAKRQLAQI